MVLLWKQSLDNKTLQPLHYMTTIPTQANYQQLLTAKKPHKEAESNFTLTTALN